MTEAEQLTMARRSKGGAVASPHYLATLAGARVLAEGGNAVDAAVAVNATLGVVAPYLCGFGGDVLAMVWDGEVHGYLGVGRAPEAGTIERVSSLIDAPVRTGAITVTPAGAFRGFFDLLDRWGTRSFGDLATEAIRYGRDGVTLTPGAVQRITNALAMHPQAGALHDQYAGPALGDRMVQPELAALLELVAADGPDAFYSGPVAADIAEAVGAGGGLMTADDLARHEGEWVDPLHAEFRGRTIWELPPPTQGITVLEVLRILDDEVLEPGTARTHRMIEAMKLGLADRDAYVADPGSSPVQPSELLSDGWISARRAQLDPSRATDPGPGVQQIGGTASICVTDEDGLCISLIQSNFLPFGSGVFVPKYGLSLQSRGASFRLSPTHPNSWAPGKLPLHTLVPALATSDGRPSLVFGTMGADAQAQVHVQLLTRLFDDGASLRDALDTRRWRVEPGSWNVRTEDGASDVAALEALGHVVEQVPAPDEGMGHANLIALAGGGRLLDVATDARAEGLALIAT